MSSSPTIMMQVAKALLTDAGYYVRPEGAPTMILAVYAGRHGSLLAKLNVDQNRHCERVLVVELIERLGQ